MKKRNDPREKTATKTLLALRGQKRRAYSATPPGIRGTRYPGNSERAVGWGWGWMPGVLSNSACEPGAGEFGISVPLGALASNAAHDTYRC
jgi:hypothetical protein